MIGDVFLRIMDAGFGVSLLLAAVCALRFFLRSSPSWMMRALWALVALRLLFPFYVEVPYEREREEGTAALEQLGPERMSELVYGEQRVSTYEQEPAPKTESAQVAGGEIDFKDAVPYLWLIVSVGVLSVGIVRYARLKRKVRFAYPTDKGVFEAEGIGASFVFGIIRPRIYLPAGLGEPMRSHVIAHERAHIACGDHLTKALAYLLLSVYWFNPLMWAAFVLFCRDIEFQCDRSVVRGMDHGDRRSYALSLVKIGTGRARVARRIITISPIHFGEVGLKGRVRSIMKFSQKIKWTMIVAGVLAIGLATMLFASSFTAPAPDKQLYKNTEKIYMMASSGRLVSVDAKSGQEYGRDAEGKLISYTAYSADGTVESKYEYEYDADGNNAVQYTRKPNGEPWYQHNYEYDADGNETKETLVNEDGSISWWAYSEYVGGKLVKRSEYNSSGSLSSWEEHAFDADGNEIIRTYCNSDGSIESFTEYGYDADGNMISCTEYDSDSNLDARYTYEYDANGNKVKITRYNSFDTVADYTVHEYVKIVK